MSMANTNGINRITLSVRENDKTTLTTDESGKKVRFSADSYIRTKNGVPAYEGSYSFTPTTDYQTIEIKDKRATADIVINPIPSNYGLITWNGSTLTVS